MSAARILTLLFDTTTAALWAEELARYAGLPVEVVPAPAGSDAKCDLALITPWDRRLALVTTLTDAGVPFREWEEPRPT